MCWHVAQLAVYGRDSTACCSLNLLHRYRFDKFRVFEQKLFRLSPVEASELKVSRAGTITDCAMHRGSIGDWVIVKLTLWMKISNIYAANKNYM